MNKVMMTALKEKKMKRLVMILLISFLFICNLSYAGNGDLIVGGALQMTSTANGFLPPRMNTSEMGSLSPSPGMLIYNTDNNTYNYYTGSGWNILGAGLPVHNNSGVSSDYSLAVGETANITYSSATSVPLHIATVQGEYEITILGNATSPSSDADAGFSPNNTSYSGAITDVGWYQATNSAFESSNSTGSSTFDIGATNVIKSILRCTTVTASKSVFSSTLAMTTSGNGTLRDTERHQYWNDTTTAWTSLGTITFPFAQSGVVMVRRLL